MGDHLRRNEQSRDRQRQQKIIFAEAHPYTHHNYQRIQDFRYKQNLDKPKLRQERLRLPYAEQQHSSQLDNNPPCIIKGLIQARRCENVMQQDDWQ